MTHRPTGWVRPGPRPRRALGPSRLLALVVTAVLGVVLLPAPPAQAAFETPGFVRSIGGRGEAGVYAWGTQYNPVTNEVLVSDYWNYQIRRYDTSGRQVGAFFRPASIRKGQPYSIAVDPRDGSIYVPEIGEGKERGWIAKYDKTGKYLFEVFTQAQYTAWITVDDSGHLYVADSHFWSSPTRPPKIRKFRVDNATRTATQVADWGTFGSGPGEMGIIHGMATDGRGNLFVADATNRVVHQFTEDGAFVRDFGSRGTGLGQFTGDLRGLTVDRVNGWVYVVDAEAAEVEKFTLTGTPVLNWGSEGSGPGQMADGGRQITIDGAGNVHVADYGNYRQLVFDSDGTPLRAYPDPAAPPPPGGFAQVRDVAVNRATGEVLAADSWNNRFQNPWDIDLIDGRLYVTDAQLNRVQVFSTAGEFLGRWGTGGVKPGQFTNPSGIDHDAAGNIYIADAGNSRVQVFSLTPRTGRDTTAPVGTLRSPTTAQVLPAETVWVTGTAQDAVGVATVETAVLDRDQNLWWNASLAIWSKARTWNLAQVWGADLTSAQWRSAFNGVQRGGRYSVQSRATDAAGNVGAATPATAFSVEGVATVATPPDTTLTAPATGSTVPAGPVVVAGDALDDTGVRSVAVSVRDASTGLWWDAPSRTWGSKQGTAVAVLASPSATTTTWSYTFDSDRAAAVGGTGRYFVTAGATDISGATDATRATTRFTVR